jgi:uncharacterized membrane protein YebE (DUF533 family)
MTAVKTRKTQKLLKILIGAAWIDGVIEPEERKYLQRIAKDLDLAKDREIWALLSEIKRVTPQECYQWIEEYTSDNPNVSDYHDLLEKISALIYSDGYVDVRETQLIERLQLCDPSKQSCTNVLERVLKKIQRMYQNAIQEQS